MLVIRYNRVGRRNHAHFRVVVQEHTAAPGGRHVAIVGSYNPHTKEAILKADEIKKFLANGAQASDSVWNLLVREGIVEGTKRAVKVPAKEAPEGEDEAATEGAEEKKAEEASAEEKTEESKEDAPADDAKAEEVK